MRRYPRGIPLGQLWRRYCSAPTENARCLGKWPRYSLPVLRQGAGGAEARTITRTVQVPKAPLGDLRHHLQATTAPGKQALPQSKGNTSSPPAGALKACGMRPIHLQYWRSCTSDTWVLATAHNGYVLQFRKGPPPFRGVMNTSVTDPLQVLVLQQKVAALLCKQAIRLVDPTSHGEGFYSRFFNPVPALTRPALGDPASPGSLQSDERHSLASRTRQVPIMGMAPGRDRWSALGLSDTVVGILQNTRAGSTRSLYVYKFSELVSD
ncbi:UNVERIFIED_CONTAM: hypothetical protein FKN15_023471 [Acipenser sinensis]